MTNDEVMRHLLDHARKLDGEGGALFQVRAFRSAALIVQGLPRPVEEILRESGRKGLESIPGVGKSIAYALEQLSRTDEAIQHYREAIRLNRDYTRAHGNLGTLFAKLRRTDEAVAE